MKRINSNQSNSAFNFINGGNNTTLVSIESNGRVLIGSKKPSVGSVHQDALLSIYGKVLAKSVFITVASGVWADYVFEPSYNKKSIQELSEYLKVNKHLPGMQTSKEVELNGLNVVETQAKLLEKLEEAYLYIIELKERIDVIEKKTQKN